MSDNRKDRYCPSCGEKLQLGETHCEYCGTTYVEKPKPVIESKRIITGFPTKKSKKALIGMILVMEDIGGTSVLCNFYSGDDGSAEDSHYGTFPLSEI